MFKSVPAAIVLYALRLSRTPQVRSLHRMTSNVLTRGLGSMRSGASSRSGGLGSSSGGFGQRSASAAAVLSSRPGSRLGYAAFALLEGSGHAGDALAGSEGLGDGMAIVEGCESEGLASPVTPARPSGLDGGDLLGEPLLVGVGGRRAGAYAAVSGCMLCFAVLRVMQERL